MSRFLKKILPHSLFRRFLLIILLPNIIVQLFAVYMFYERHWSGVSKHMAVSLAGDIQAVVNGIEANGINREEFVNKVVSTLYIGVKVIPNSAVNNKVFEAEDELALLKNELDARFRGRGYNMYLSGEDPIIVTEVQSGDNVILITASKKRLFNPSTYIFVMWMTCTAGLFVLIAIFFMRNQVRSITNLAEAAEKFGRGQDMPEFKPYGATEVRQAAQAFLDMKNRINRHVEQRTEMLAGVSHDLKTPLTRMKLQLAMMPQSEEVSELQHDILELEKMVQEYIDFAKGKERVVDANVNIADMLRSIVVGYRNQPKKIEISTQNGLVLHINSNSLRRAITNIVDNALKYGNSVQISATSSEKYIYITIEDDGPGIPKNKREEVFKPFFRLDRSRNLDLGGTGLGLAIARDIIIGYGGDIILEDSPKGGLRVVIKLPF